MIKVYENTNVLDKNCIFNFGISPDILMENAASKIEQIVREKLPKHSKVIALCGGGNNAADGICSLRKLSLDYDCRVYFLDNKLNQMCKKQLFMAKKCGVKIVDDINQDYDCYIDSIFGSGLNRELDEKYLHFFEIVNSRCGLKVAVDVPSGIGNVNFQNAFKADITICMGALKLSMFNDFAKNFVGDIFIANLGVSNINYELHTNYFLLEKADLILPKRLDKCSNKSNNGHVFVIAGNMHGAPLLAALGANNIGSGLVSIVSKNNINLPPNIMLKQNIDDAKVVVCGCGFGRKIGKDNIFYNDLKFNFSMLEDKSCVLDADIFYYDGFKEFIQKNKNTILTPHPKEFVQILKICDIVDIGVDELQGNRFKYAKMFCDKFDSVLVLKGANTIISQKDNVFIANLGTPKLSKGGMGDVLSGIIAGLLAQNYSPIDASINGVLTHILASNNSKINDFAFDATDLIQELKWM